MEYKTGDIITARVKNHRWLFHKAIVVRINDRTVLLLHNSPNSKNEYGGNLLIDTPEDFYKSREFVYLEHTNLTVSEIFRYYHEMKRKAFNLLFYNCEHFVSMIAYNVKKSEQLRYWFTVLIFIACIIFIVKKSHR